MKKKEQWNNFFALERSICYSEHLQETIKLAHCTNASHTIRYRISMWHIVVKQLKFFALKIWLLQGLLLAALCALFFQLYSISVVYGVDAFEWAKRVLPKSLCLGAGAIAVSAIPLLSRSTHYKMAELEQSTYFSLRGNLFAQLLFMGIGDLGMLSALILLAIKFRITGDTIFLSLIIPFLTSATFCLILWMRTTPSFFRNAGVILCGASALFVYQIADNSKLLIPEAALYIWILYALTCIGIMYYACSKLYYHSAAETNFN